MYLCICPFAGKCTSAGNCGDTLQYICDQTAAKQSCSCSEVDGTDTCVSLGTCKATTCGVCSTCVSQLQPFTRQWKDSPNSTAVAIAWLHFCSNNVKPENGAICSTIQSQIHSNINTGKRSGALCKALDRCPAIPDTKCPITTTVLSGVEVKSVLDMCTVEGVQSGSAVPGVSATNALLPMRCYLDGSSSCGAGWQCSTSNNKSIITCLDGTDTYGVQGMCEKTPCQNCQDCLAAAQSFAFSQLTSADTTAILRNWQSWCNSTTVFTPGQCQLVHTVLQDHPTVAKRAAGICGAAGLCNGLLTCNVTVRSRNGAATLAATSLDYCTRES